jgi:ferredoxin-type protein NapH
MNTRLPLKELKTPLILMLGFWILAVVLSLSLKNNFYLFNFGYIGTSLGIGLGAYSLLPGKQKPWGRRLAQFLVGLYMLGFLGLLQRENMQIEGFFFYLLGGVFAGSVIHYLVAKVVGPLFFGRGWCGWACWTVMILDLLPFKRHKDVGLERRFGFIRYIHFGLSLALVLILWFVFGVRTGSQTISELAWLVAGDLLYYASGIALAYIYKDNRAFCKVLCPIPTLQKLPTRYGLLKLQGNDSNCTSCGACNKACLMDIDVRSFAETGRRVTSSECIQCMECIHVCPHDALSVSFRLGQ